MDGNTDDRGDEALEGDADRGMFAGDGGEGTRRTLNYVLAVLDNLGDCAKLVVQEVARGGNPRANTSGGTTCSKQLVGKARREGADWWGKRP